MGQGGAIRWAREGQLSGPGKANWVGQGGAIRWAREGQLGGPGGAIRWAREGKGSVGPGN